MIPTMPTAPTMNQGMFGGNMLSTVPPDMANKIVKDSTKTLSSLIQQHVAEGYQALTQAGVGVGDAANHILGELIKMAPQKSASGDANLTSPGGQPPQNMIPNQQRQPQPPNPNPGVKSNNDQSAQAVASTDTNTVPAQQAQTSQPQDTNSILGQLLTAIQSKSGQQMNMPSAFGGLIQPTAQNQALLAQTALAKQKLAGQEPMQVGDLQKLIAGVGEKQLSAQVVPPSQYEKKALEAGGYTAQRDAYNKQIEAASTQEKNLVDYMKQQQEYAKSLPGGMWFHQDLIKNVQDAIQKTRDYRTGLQREMDNLLPQQPNFTGKQSGSSSGMITIRNKKTGETKSVSSAYAKKIGALNG